MISRLPGYDEVVLAAPDGERLCNSLACARAGRVAVVVVTYGVLNDPDAGYHDRGALWRDCWAQSYWVCGTCWEQTYQVIVKYRPGLVVINTTGRPVAAESSGGRE